MKKTQIFQLVLLTSLFISILAVMNNLDTKEFGKSLNILFGFSAPVVDSANSAGFVRSARLVTRDSIIKIENRDLSERSNIDKAETKQ